MATVQFTDWLPYVQAEVDGCPRAMIMDAIRQTVIAFCGRSRIWRLQCNPLTTQVGVNTYSLEIPSYAQCVSVRSVIYNDWKPVLEERTTEQLDAAYVEWRTTSGKPKYYVFQSPNIITFDKVPDAEVGVQVLVALKPRQNALEVDEMIFEEYRDQIASGAISRLMLMVDKPWSNAQIGVMHAGRFEDSVNVALSRANHGFGTRHAARVKPQYL